MKGNNGSGNIEDRDTWETPKELFKRLNLQYVFDIDCCASKNNNKCELFYDNFELATKEDLKLNNCWMNPPFSKAKEMFEHFFKVVEVGVAIYRCDNLETSVWQDIIFKYADWIFIPKGRISYEGIQGKGSRFPSALIGFGCEPPIYDLGIEGTLLTIK